MRRARTGHESQDKDAIEPRRAVRHPGGDDCMVRSSRTLSIRGSDGQVYPGKRRKRPDVGTEVPGGSAARRVGAVDGRLWLEGHDRTTCERALSGANVRRRSSARR